MARRFSKRITRKKTYKLTPKQADIIFRKEYVDAYGNKHRLQFNFEPHLPNEGDMQLKYKQGEK